MNSFKLKKFDNNRTLALERQAKHEIVQFFFNDRYYYFMNSYMLDVNQVKEDLKFFNETRDKVNQVLTYATVAEMAEPELYKMNPANANITEPPVNKRLLTLDMRNYEPNGKKAHFQGGSAPAASNQSNATAISIDYHEKAALYEKYKAYIMGMIEADPLMRLSMKQLDEFQNLQESFTQGIDNNFQFSEAINDLRGELREKIMNFLFANNYKEVYKVEEQNLWLLGWLLFSQEQFADWSTRPKDMISLPQNLYKINGSDFTMVSNYLEELVQEVTKRTLFQDIDNARFGFLIYRGLKYNITDITNVTNCTNKQLKCPCPVERDPMDHSYCDPLPKTQTLKQNGTRLRVLATVTLTQAPAANASNNTTTTGPVKSNASNPASSPFKKSDEDLNRYDEKIEIAPVFTPFTAITNLEANLKTEKDIVGFILAYKFIMRTFLQDELLNIPEKKDA